MPDAYGPIVSGVRLPAQHRSYGVAGQVTPLHVGAAPAVEVPICAAQSEAVSISHVSGWPDVVGTQQATGGWHPAQTLPVPEL